VSWPTVLFWYVPKRIKENDRISYSGLLAAGFEVGSSLLFKQGDIVLKEPTNASRK
jgi:hypothetical protein